MTNDPKKPDDTKIDWVGQIRNTLVVLVAVVAVFALMRYFGLRG